MSEWNTDVASKFTSANDVISSSSSRKSIIQIDVTFNAYIFTFTFTSKHAWLKSIHDSTVLPSKVIEIYSMYVCDMKNYMQLILIWTNFFFHSLNGWKSRNDRWDSFYVGVTNENKFEKNHVEYSRCMNEIRQNEWFRVTVLTWRWCNKSAWEESYFSLPHGFRVSYNTVQNFKSNRKSR